jgi:hypothetical protein
LRVHSAHLELLLTLLSEVEGQQERIRFDGLAQEDDDDKEDEQEAEGVGRSMLRSSGVSGSHDQMIPRCRLELVWLVVSRARALPSRRLAMW